MYYSRLKTIPRGAFVDLINASPQAHRFDYALSSTLRVPRFVLSPPSCLLSFFFFFFFLLSTYLPSFFMHASRLPRPSNLFTARFRPPLPPPLFLSPRSRTCDFFFGCAETFLVLIQPRRVQREVNRERRWN